MLAHQTRSEVSTIHYQKYRSILVLIPHRSYKAVVDIDLLQTTHYSHLNIDAYNNEVVRKSSFPLLVKIKSVCSLNQIDLVVNLICLLLLTTLNKI